MTTKEELEQLKKKIADLEAKIAKEEKQEIKTVEDAWAKLKPDWYIDEYGNIEQNIGMINFRLNQCNMTSEKEVKRIKALIQLKLIAEAMNEGVDRDGYWYITNDFIFNYTSVQHTIVMIAPIFHTEEIAMQALKNFRPLFEDLYA